MKAIFKYTIPIGRHFCIPVPRGSRTLSVGLQGDDLQAWVLVDLRNTESPMAATFFAVGTGWELTGEQLALIDGLPFMGTVQTSAGLVWHVFGKVSA